MRASAHLVWIVACSAGALVIAMLVVVYRRAAASRELELAEELLDAELRSLDEPDRERS